MRSTVLLFAGLFRSSKSYYLYKTSSTFAILAAALTVLVRWHESMWGLVGSAFLLGLFWQQGGWLAHDYLHHQVRKCSFFSIENTSTDRSETLSAWHSCWA